MTSKRGVFGIALVGLSMIAQVAAAQGRAAVAPAAKDTGAKEGQGYGYTFNDDPLSAGGLGANDATIKIRPGPVRSTLIRPRTTFVPEMLKSIESL